MINLIALGALAVMVIVPIVLMEMHYRKEEKAWKEYVESFFMENKKEEKK